MNEEDVSALVDWMAHNGVPPLQYLISKCQMHQVVLLGEMHEIRDNLLFLADAIPVLHEEANVTCIGLEVCNAEDNPDIARLVAAPDYDEQLALRIARSQNWGIWGWKEYWDLLRAVWRLNRAIPRNGSKMRVIGIDRKMDLLALAKQRMGLITDPRELATFEREQRPLFDKRDMLMAQQVETEIIRRGERGVVLVGNAHAFTHYRQPNVKDGKFVSEMDPRMGHILHAKYGEDVFQITLHLDNASPLVADPTYCGKKPCLVDLVEAVMARQGNKPIGFDVFASPLAAVRDNGSYYFHYQPEVVFADVCRGYIFLAPWEHLRHCEWIPGFVSKRMFSANKEFFEAKFNREFGSAEEVNSLFSAVGRTPIGH